MAVLTSAHAALKYKGVVVGRVRNFDMNISRAALNTTQLGDWDETYRNGLRTGTASATLLYDPSEAQMVAMMNGIFSDSDTPDAVQIELGLIAKRFVRPPWPQNSQRLFSSICCAKMLN